MEIGRHFSLKKQAQVNAIKSLGAELLLLCRHCCKSVPADERNSSRAKSEEPRRRCKWLQQ